MLDPCVRAVSIYSFVDAKHAGNFLTRRSHTDINMFVNNAPIFCFSQKQDTVEAATFGIELVALSI